MTDIFQKLVRVEMSDWIHCNVCYGQPGASPGLRYFATNCGHLYCQKCVDTLNGKCRICGLSGCSVFRLSSRMNPEVERFFTDPRELVKRNAREMSDVIARYQKSLLEVLAFQRNHRNRLNTHRTHQLTNNRALDESKWLDKVESLKNENVRLKELVQNHVVHDTISVTSGGSAHFLSNIGRETPCSSKCREQSPPPCLRRARGRQSTPPRVLKDRNFTFCPFPKNSRSRHAADSSIRYSRL
ncbi:hypothetical protein ACOME3_002169 [Neoechinorhynchus agilis]